MGNGIRYDFLSFHIFQIIFNDIELYDVDFEKITL